MNEIKSISELNEFFEFYDVRLYRKKPSAQFIVRRINLKFEVKNEQ